MKILICSPEMFPFVKTGGLADVIGALSSRLTKQGLEVAVVLPKYRAIDKKFKTERIDGVSSYLMIDKNIKIYFIQNENYFGRDGLYGDKFGDYEDNLERFVFYCRETLALIKKINFKPDIIHCHEWQAALVPVYLKTKLRHEPFYKGIKTLFTIHNLAYQGIFPKEEFIKLSLDDRLFSVEALEFYGNINLLKGALIFSDIINTVSPAHAKEILTPQFGCGLEGVLAQRKKRLFGVLNGLDYDTWNPQTDKFIFKNYSVKKISDKYVNKNMLQKKLKLKANSRPLFGMVSRLVSQKGLDLISEALSQMCREDAQFVILGTGELKYHKLLKKMQAKYPDKISVHIKFDERLAHRIYAASDIFLMPSYYEPCGLGQMISLAYGTVPLVFKTGGLSDTVSGDNGFVFKKYDKKSFLDVFKHVISLYDNKPKWAKLVKRTFSYNFSWQDSAREYIALYKKCMSSA